MQTSFESVQRETASFFSTITYPSVLKAAFSLQDIQNRTQNTKFQLLWNLVQKKGINCFQLVGSQKKRRWQIFFIDLETPILFIPTTHGSLAVEKFLSFSNILKTIKSNLLQKYSQESEAMIVQVKNEEKETSDSPFTTYKVEDQERPEKSGRNSIMREGQQSLHTYLGKKEEDRTRLEEEERIYLRKGRRRNPFGQFNPKNRLNTLTGREWIRFSKSWRIERPPPRNKNEILHPAKFPETMVRSYITFFTKKGQLVLDPFLGSGSMLVTAKQCNRNGVGIELSDFYADIAQTRVDEIGDLPYSPLYQTEKKGSWRVIKGDARDLPGLWTKHKLPQLDFCITSPPYWNQLARNNIRQKARKNQGLDTRYSENDPNDLGNIRDYHQFLKTQQTIFGHVYTLLRNKGYLVVVTNNVFTRGRLFPLAYDTATSLVGDENHPWVLKDEKLWLQDDKALLALGVNNAWVGNRCHQYCLIFRKEEGK
ncbi:MAG: DNA methyltransferase [Candidatus Heimdallarchaeota archaeon]